MAFLKKIEIIDDIFIIKIRQGLNTKRSVTMTRIRIAYFIEAKEALLNFFVDSKGNKNKIENFGISKEEFSEYINDFDSPLYDPEFIYQTILPYDELDKDEEGYFVELKKII